MEPPPSPEPAPRRVITRPPHHRPGSAAPWADLPADRRGHIPLEQVRAAMADDRALRVEDSTEPWRTLADRVVVEGRPAAVLVACFEEAGEARVVLTRRSDLLRAHQGEVAFPGGRLDGDEGVVRGALREAREEVGLDPGSVTVIGRLTAMPTVASDTVMTPVVGTLGSRPSLVANPGEVDRVFDVALSDLVADGVFSEEWWAVPGRPGVPGYPQGEFPVWFFEVAGETVWGATARTLVELLCLILEVGVRPPLASA